MVTNRSERGLDGLILAEICTQGYFPERNILLPNFALSKHLEFGAKPYRDYRNKSSMDGKRPTRWHPCAAHHP